MAPLPLPPAEAIKLVSLAEIARGGMGSVELARADGGRLHGQLLAVKRLHPNIAQDPQFVGMFLDEAWMTAAIKSRNVVQVAAWGNDDKGMFLAVEFVHGVSLARLIKEAKQNEEPFAERTVAYLGAQICAGLAAAHDARGPDGSALSLVHRDLTPGNILVGFDGEVKIADFGIARAEERITQTQAGTLKGKPSYMAPEQARGSKVDGRTDLFSFGVMMFEMLGGRRPWVAKSAFDVMLEIATSEPPDLAGLRKGVNPQFVEIVNTCLRKRLEERFSNAGEIRARLDAWRTGKGFAEDDQRSLAHFVTRNSTEQLKWFDDAMRGELARVNAPTFKELEERIDAARAAPTVRPMRPAAGRPALASSPGSTRQQSPSSKPTARPPRASPPPAAAVVPERPLDETAEAPTMLMQGPAPPFHTQSGPRAVVTLGPDPRVERRDLVMGPSPAPERLDRSGFEAPVAKAPEAAPKPEPPVAPAPTASDPGASDPGSGTPIASATKPARRSRLGLVLLLVALPVLLGGGATAWRFRERLFQASHADRQPGR